MGKRWLGICLWVLALLPLAAAPAGQGAEDPTVVFFLRHAEKEQLQETRDPGLSSAGLARAEALASLLGRARVTHLYATEYRRTQQTLEPLARQTKLEVHVLPAGDTAAQVRAVQELPAGAVAVVAGHSDTIPQMIHHLGGQVSQLDEKGRLGEHEYDRLFVVVLPRPGTRAGQALELHY